MPIWSRFPATACEFPSRRRIVQQYFDDWFKKANNFYEIFEFRLGKRDFSLAAFALNQAAEHGPVFEDIFPQETKEQRDLFALLDNAYIAGRYRMGFNVDHEHLDYLAVRVRKLLAVTEEVCRREIVSIGSAV